MTNKEKGSLSCDYAVKGSYLIYNISGTLTIYQPLDIKEEIEKFNKLYINESIENIIFNLAELDFMDSYGVSIIIDFNTKYNKMNKKMSIFYGQNEKLKDLFKTIRIELIVPIMEQLP